MMCSLNETLLPGGGCSGEVVSTIERSGNEWRELLYTRMRGNPYPLFHFSDMVIPAASIWSGARLWTKRFRETGLLRGDRILVVLPASAAFVQVLIACLWEGYTVAFAPPHTDSTTVSSLVDVVDARCVVASNGDAGYIFTPDLCEGPVEREITLRDTRFPKSPEACFLLRTSGSRSENGGKWIALSDRNVLSVIQSHLPVLGMEERKSIVLSALPWHHAFGLILDLLPAVLSGVEIVRDPHDGRDTLSLLSLAQQAQATYFSAVPVVLKRLATTPEGRLMLCSLQGGIVGGAPVDRDLAAFLSTTNLRAGYGQTEASPGISLGPPGHWPSANYLGRPLGCQIRMGEEGDLLFSGENACYGSWSAGEGLTEISAEWRSSGDIVRVHKENGDLFFHGRIDDNFKLENGRRIEAGILEQQVRESLPVIEDCLLFSPDGEHLTLLWTSTRRFCWVEKRHLRRCLGGLENRLTETVRVPVDAWHRTRKGATDRPLLISRFNRKRAEDAPSYGSWAR